MLSTLLKIGEWQSQGKSEWDRFCFKTEPRQDSNLVISYLEGRRFIHLSYAGLFLQSLFIWMNNNQLYDFNPFVIGIGQI